MDTNCWPLYLQCGLPYVLTACTVYCLVQVDALRSGILGKDRAAFSFRYCNRRLVPVGRRNTNSKKYDNSGLSRAGELHALLKEVNLALMRPHNAL